VPLIGPRHGRLNKWKRCSTRCAKYGARPTPAPPSVRPLNRTDIEGWALVAVDPKPFLSPGLRTSDWLDRSLPRLLEAEASARLKGDRLVHLDMRSDNLCFIGNRVVIVDWDNAALANPDLDLAAWAHSLHLEGGPPPEALLPHAPSLAALISGYFAARAGLPPIPRAEGVRRVQLTQLRPALSWTIRALGLSALEAPPGSRGRARKTDHNP